MGDKSRRKRKDKKLQIIFISCSLVFLCTMFFSLYKMLEVSKSSNKDNSKEVVSLLKNRKTKDDKGLSDNKESNKEVIIKISAVGDCTLGSDSDARGNTFTSVYNKKNDPSYFFSGVKEILSKDDITIANLEGPLTTRGKASDKKFSFRGSPEYTEILTKGSVEAVNLANNHSMDYGQIGFEDTKKYLDKSKIEHFGYDKKSIIDKKGIKIGFLGYKGWSNNSEVKKNVESSIKNLKNEVDIVIVSFHWGEERAQSPNKVQKTLGKLAIESGADLVLGHHPHVIQGIEEYNGKYIVYSLGNFSFGGNTNPKDKDSFIYQQEFKFDSSKKLVNISNPETIPVSISSSKNVNDYRPYILDGDEKERVTKKIKNSSNLIN